jgi:hypothetical protein
MGPALMQNRHDPVVQADATQANGRLSTQPHWNRSTGRFRAHPTRGADKTYDARKFVADLRQK